MAKIYYALYCLIILIFSLFAVVVLRSNGAGDFGKPTDWLLIAFTALLALFTYQLRRSTDKLWDAGERQIKVAIGSADAAKRSADLAEAAIINQSRAWLDIEIDASTATLSYDENNGLGFRADFKVENKGNSPALNALIGLHIVFPTSGSGQEWADEIRRKVATPDDIPFGNMVFSEEEFTQNVGTGIGLEETRRQEGRLNLIYQTSATTERFIPISIVATVSYGIIGDKARHYTTRIYGIRSPRQDPRRGVYASLPAFGRDLNPENIILQREHGAEFAS